MPPSSTVGPEGNPFLFLGGMNQALDILSVEMSGPDTAGPILSAHQGVSYVAEPDRSSSGSVIRLAVEGDNPDRVTAALRDVVALVPGVLTSMQDEQNVPEKARIGLMPLVLQDTPIEDTKTRTVSVVAVAGGGVAMSILLAGLIDGRLLARALRRELAGQSVSIPGVRRAHRGIGERPTVNRLKSLWESRDHATAKTRG
ncbi:hypothetical protein [Pseudarthrobacter sulfonivorans]|uniref:hypothetical protein n=1 Tax=Pseudarthrobacter sulfonivorans TaxID=121292 RepID=UPI00210612BA|nr:hypothetical protein [Pseudarthrobacter sulfonivorans]